MKCNNISNMRLHSISWLDPIRIPWLPEIKWLYWIFHRDWHGMHPRPLISPLPNSILWQFAHRRMCVFRSESNVQLKSCRKWSFFGSAHCVSLPKIEGCRIIRKLSDASKDLGIHVCRVEGHIKELIKSLRALPFLLGNWPGGSPG